MQITIKGIPPTQSACSIPGKYGWFRSRVGEEWDALVMRTVGDRRAPESPFYAVTVTICQPSKKGKLSCRFKTLFDALTKCGFWEDDRKVASIVVQYGPRSLEKTIVDVRPVKRKWK